MYALQNASAVTTNATELVKKAKAFVDREIHLIPNGVDTKHFMPAKKNDVLAETLGLTGKKKGEKSVIGFVGELRNKKGLTTLLSAYTQANKNHLLTLLIVGEVREGDDKKIFEDFQRSNPDANVIVTGYIPHSDLPSYYSLMDVFIHPSLRDGMPNAVLEAMACGKAVIATPVGGTKDILEDGKNGAIVNVNDTKMLAQKITELLDDPKKREILGKNARESIVSKYTPGQELEENLIVYSRLGL